MYASHSLVGRLSTSSTKKLTAVGIQYIRREQLQHSTFYCNRWRLVAERSLMSATESANNETSVAKRFIENGEISLNEKQIISSLFFLVNKADKGHQLNFHFCCICWYFRNWSKRLNNFTANIAIARYCRLYRLAQSQSLLIYSEFNCLR